MSKYRITCWCRGVVERIKTISVDIVEFDKRPSKEEIHDMITENLDNPYSDEKFPNLIRNIGTCISDCEDYGIISIVRVKEAKK